MSLRQLNTLIEHPKVRGAIILAMFCALVHWLAFLWFANVKLAPLEPLTKISLIFWSWDLPFNIQIPRELDFLVYPLFLFLVYRWEFRDYDPYSVFDYDDGKSYDVYEVILCLSLFASIIFGFIYFIIVLLLCVIGALALVELLQYCDKHQY